MSVNKVILVGNVGKDPEIRYFDNDNAKASFSLATRDRGYTTSNGTQIPERTEWHNIVCWRGLAQIVEKFVRKGSLLYVEGKIRVRSYDDQNGIKRYITEINAENIEILGKRASANDNADDAAPNSKPADYDMSADFSDNSDVDDLPF